MVSSVCAFMEDSHEDVRCHPRGSSEGQTSAGHGHMTSQILLLGC